MTLLSVTSVQSVVSVALLRAGKPAGDAFAGRNSNAAEVSFAQRKTTIVHPCRCDSRNHSFLSRSREMPVNRSDVPLSPISSA